MKESKKENYQEIIEIDGSLNNNKIQYLIGLKHEEEKLDYKVGFPLESKLEHTKCKVDIVSDILAMANTLGGYLIIGVDDSTHEIIGVDEDNEKKLTQENIQNYVSSYIESNITVKVRNAKIDGKSLICICIFKTLIPIPFRKEGVYRKLDNKDYTKFRIGEIFVRHGSKSERANYNDYSKFVENIRSDERRKSMNSDNRFEVFNIQLSEIIRLLGGENNTDILNNNLFSGDDEKIEYKTLKIDTTIMPFYFKRTFIKKFKEIENDAKEIMFSKREHQEKIELANRKFKDELLRIIPVWMAAVHKNDLQIGEELTRQIFSILHKLGTADNTYENDYKNDSNPIINSLYFIEQILYLINVLGAISVWFKKLQFAKLLVNKTVEYHFGFHDENWLRYIFTMLNRNKKMDEDLITKATNFGLQSSYLKAILEFDFRLRIFIGQFDFYQCLNVLLDDKLENSIFPNYMLLGKEKQIEPIIETIINKFQTDDILYSTDEEKIKNAINYLNSEILKNDYTFAKYSWRHEWYSSKIIEFLNA